MMRKPEAFIIVGLIVAVAGCQRLDYGSRPAPAPLQPTPVAPVASGQLQPLETTPNGTPLTGQPLDGTVATAPLDGQETVTGTVPTGNGAPVGRTDLLGGWTVASGGDTCKLFMTLTTWSGGYRANTRGCSNATLAGVSAWDLQGNQIKLKDGGGADVAALVSNAPEQFNGTTNGGAPISVFR
ncbi:MAG: AprI/Inh family metalloprotease inhibitor [Stappiaceae bacterium]